MFIADNFIYAHVPRTGGTFTKGILVTRYPNGCFIDQFASVTDLPARYHSWPTFGAVRNPWDWYVSWAAYNKKLPAFDDFLKANIGQYKEWRRTILKGVINIFKFESLYEGLAEMLNTRPAEIEKRRAINGRPHRHYSKYYTRELAELVLSNECEFIEYYKYSYEVGA